MRSLLVLAAIVLRVGLSGSADAAVAGFPAALQPAGRSLASSHPALAEKQDLRAPWTRVARSLREIVAGVGSGALPPGPPVASAMSARGLRADQANRVHVTVRVLPKAAKVNKAGTRATIAGSAKRLNLRSGANRVRLLAGALHSNIVVLDR